MGRLRDVAQRCPCLLATVPTPGCFMSNFSFRNSSVVVERDFSIFSKMADEDVNGDSDEVLQQEKSQKKAAKYDSGAADLEKVTDYAEEKEITSSDGFSSALSIIGDRRNKEAAEKKAKEKELLKVSIKKEDVDLIMKEMEINRNLAERTLREHRGNVVEALVTLTN